jgi:hypothetical protein
MYKNGCGFYIDKFENEFLKGEAIVKARSRDCLAYF